MQSSDTYNLDENVENWRIGLEASPDLTEQDVEELKLHLLESIDHLMETGLDKEEAFWVASKRMGYLQDCEEEYSKANTSIKQLQKTLALFMGVLLYVLFYNLILATSKVLLITLRSFNIEILTTINWFKYYIVGIQFLFLTFTVSIYFLEDITVNFLRRVRLTIKKAIGILTITAATRVIEIYLRPIFKNCITPKELRGLTYEISLYFDYSFPLLIGIAFIVLYSRYNKKALID